MAEIEVRSSLLHKAADTCEVTTAVQVRYARDMLADAEGAPDQARMRSVVAAAVAKTCIAAWHDASRDAHRSVHAICDTVHDTRPGHPALHR